MTTMAPRTARWLTVGFALLIVSVPLSEVVLEAQAGTLTCLDIFRGAPTLAHIQGYEKALDRNLRVAKAVRPWTQYGSTKLLDRGNEKVIVARPPQGDRREMLYRPSFSHHVGPPVSSDDVEGQPYHAIVAYHRALAERGIKLVVLALPMKVDYEVSELVPRDGEPCRNPGVGRLFEKLRTAGVFVDDAYDLFTSTWQSSTPLYHYLPYDTHWSPGLMELEADGLGHFLREAGWLDGVPERHYAKAPAETVENHGDLFDMLDLPPSQDLFETWSEEIEPILAPDGSPWKPDPNGPILLLGDSFTNVYSDPALHWGSGAGFAEHLAYHAQAGVDVIALNDGGVNGCRQALARQPQRLEGKRVVVWQFATRDLSLKAGDWRIVPLPPPLDLRAERERPES